MSSVGKIFSFKMKSSIRFCSSRGEKSSISPYGLSERDQVFITLQDRNPEDESYKRNYILTDRGEIAYIVVNISTEIALERGIFREI